jgi:hypothetical protein
MYKWHNSFACHVTAEDQYIGSVEFPRVQKLAPANIRSMDVCCKEEFCHRNFPVALPDKFLPIIPPIVFLNCHLV